MSSSKLKSPFPWFGGKGRAADLIWSGLGEITNYVEPFAGSLAVLLSNPNKPKIETINDIDCVAPDTRILRDDLTWSSADNIKAGDKILAFDENNGPKTKIGLGAPSKYRRFNHATVLTTRILEKPCYKLTFDDGTVISASEDHMWLAGSHKSGGRGWRWIKTANLICNRKDQRSWLLKVVSVINKEDSFEAGWLSGILDGEGHINVGPGVRTTISQNDGIVSNKIEKILFDMGIPFSKVGKKKCKQINIIGGMSKNLELLMRVRSERLISNLIGQVSEISLYGRDHKAISLISKEFLGTQKVIAIQTTSNTFIANGLASHNCFISNFWRAISNDPEAVAKYADYPVHEADLHARHQWLVSQATEQFRLKMNSDPDYYDVKVAGWWVWGMGASIGNNWLQPKGLNAAPLLSSAGGGIHGLSNNILDWFTALQKRTRRVRVCCGDWSKVVTPSVTFNNVGLSAKDITGIFLDPPYDYKGRDKVYKEENNIFSEVCDWAIKNGDNPKLRIVLCGYDGDHSFPNTWRTHNWKSGGGYSGLGNSRGKENAKREVIWFSPHCLKSHEENSVG